MLKVHLLLRYQRRTQHLLLRYHGNDDGSDNTDDGSDDPDTTRKTTQEGSSAADPTDLSGWMPGSILVLRDWKNQEGPI